MALKPGTEAAYVRKLYELVAGQRNPPDANVQAWVAWMQKLPADTRHIIAGREFMKAGQSKAHMAQVQHRHQTAGAFPYLLGRTTSEEDVEITSANAINDTWLGLLTSPEFTDKLGGGDGDDDGPPPPPLRPAEFAGLAGAGGDDGDQPPPV